MSVSSISTIGTVVLAGLLLTGCKKPTPPPSTGATNAVPVSTNGQHAAANAAPGSGTMAGPASTNPLAELRGKSLGVVTLTNRLETVLQVGDGKSCYIKPVALDPQRLQLTMSLETHQAGGRPGGLKVVTIIARPDQPFEVDFGSLVFNLTPHLATATPQ